MRAAFAEAGLRDIDEEEVSTTMIHATPEQYWVFMTDVVAAVVAGLGKADTGTQEKIRAEVLDQARQSIRDGEVQLLSTGTVIVGTR